MHQNTQFILTVIETAHDRRAGSLGLQPTIITKTEFHQLTEGRLYCAGTTPVLDDSRSDAYEISAKLVFEVAKITDESIELRVGWPQTQPQSQSQSQPLEPEKLIVRIDEPVELKAPITVHDYYETYSFALQSK